jgi:translation initiation factor IF-2
LPVRIYALAKELKLDSKNLVDICAQAGISGKGSALASLSDEEADQVKAFLNKGDSAESSSETAKKAPTAVGTARRPLKPTPPKTYTREDYIAPGGATSSRPPVLDSGGSPRRLDGGDAKKQPGEGGGSQRPAERGSPAIKLAPLPPSSMVAKPSKQAEEPAPQKPEIKLPADAIRAGRAGSKPLAEQLRQHEMRRKADTSKDVPVEVGAPGSTEPGATPARGADRRRRGAVPPAEDREGRAGLGGREARQLKRKRRTGRRTSEDDSGSDRSRRRRPKRTGTNTSAPRKENVVVELPCTVRTLSEAMGVPSRMVLGKLLVLGTRADINAQLDQETAEMLAEELGADVTFKVPATLEDQLLEKARIEDDPESLEERPPVVTFLGHVDHGKTSLLDRIIGIDVVSTESGGITQHIRAYRVDNEQGSVAFVDTPGHEAFTEMRARGANVTDIAVLVVAADDGVMPQTEEAISHARAAEVPIIVALNKIDLPGIDIDRIYQQLAANEMLPTEWGGDVEVIKCSAMTGEGLDEQFDTLLTIAELHELKANPSRSGLGTCLEAELHEGRGVVAKVLVQNGSLNVGDVIVCGAAHGRVKAIYDPLLPSQQYDSVGPSTPVNITGLDIAPEAGDRFYVMEDISQAREIAVKRAQATRTESLSGVSEHVTLENLFDRLGTTEEVQTLNLILRADVRGSIEAIKKELTKLEHPEVKLRILQATVGGITEADVQLADASDAIIIGFSVVPDEGARVLADQRGVQIRRYDIIYQVTEELKAALSGLLRPERREVDLGRALVLRTFTISRVGTVAGCRVLSGNMARDSRVRLIRENRVIGDYPVDTLRREKDDSREVREGLECGIKLSGYNDIKEGDMLEAYKIEEVARSL